MKLPPATIALAFLLGVACVAVFETLLYYQASNCSNQQQAQRSSTPSHSDPSAANKSDDGSHDKKQKAISEPFACGVAGFPTAIRQFMNHNEGFVVGGFTFLLVFVTGWLVYVTSGLRESTDKLWEAGEKQFLTSSQSAAAAMESAFATKEAVKLSREEFIASHRPRMIVRGMSLSDGNEFKAGIRPRIYASAVNIGETDATISEIRARAFILKHVERINVEPKFHPVSLAGRPPLKGGESLSFELLLDSPLTATQISQILRFFAIDDPDYECSY